MTGKQTGPVNITCTTDKLKILGVYFGTSNVEHANWIECVIKLAVINPREKVRALKWRWVPQIGDLSCMSNWDFFARYWVALAVSCKVPSWTFLRSNACPKYIGDSPCKYFTHILTVDWTSTLPCYQITGSKPSTRNLPTRPLGSQPQGPGKNVYTPLYPGPVSGLIFMVVLVRTGKWTLRGA